MSSSDSSSSCCLSGAVDHNGDFDGTNPRRRSSTRRAASVANLGGDDRDVDRTAVDDFVQEQYEILAKIRAKDGPVEKKPPQPPPSSRRDHDASTTIAVDRTVVEEQRKIMEQIERENSTRSLHAGVPVDNTPGRLEDQGDHRPLLATGLPFEEPFLPADLRRPHDCYDSFRDPFGFRMSPHPPYVVPPPSYPLSPSQESAHPSESPLFPHQRVIHAGYARIANGGLVQDDESYSDLASPPTAASSSRYHHDQVLQLPDGKRLRLKGADATYRAMQQGTAATVHCFECKAAMKVNSTAKAVYCTRCRNVTPIDLARVPTDAASGLPPMELLVASSAVHANKDDMRFAASAQNDEIDVAVARKVAEYRNPPR